MLRELDIYRLMFFGGLLMMMMILRPEGLWPRNARVWISCQKRNPR